MLLWPAEIAEEPPTDLVIHTGKGTSEGLAAGGNVSLSLPPLKKPRLALKAAAEDTSDTDKKTEDALVMPDVTEDAVESSTDDTAADDYPAVTQDGTF